MTESVAASFSLAAVCVIAMLCGTFLIFAGSVYMGGILLWLAFIVGCCAFYKAHK